MKTIQLFSLIALVLVSLACNDSKKKKHPKEKKKDKIEIVSNKVKLSSQIEWEALNPARGDKSPMAGTIWGDRKDTVQTGFLVKFVDGFSSPPHIHNVSYRAMVLSGKVHNDDPAAAKMWMPNGSYWTQPAGEVHITAAQGSENIAYVEIDNGPYLVLATEEAYDNGERPVNIDFSNMVWLGKEKTNLIKNNDAKIAFLWENEDFKGNLIKLPQAFKGKIKSNGSVFQALTVKGEILYQIPNDSLWQNLDLGSAFSSEGKSLHKLKTENGEALIYIRTNGDLRISD